MRYVFNFFKKIVNSIPNDLYEYLYLKFRCQKFFFKNTMFPIIKGSTLIATFSWEKLLLEFDLKLSLQSLCIIHYKLPGVYCRSQKNPHFIKNSYCKNKPFSSLPATFEKKQKLQKQAYFDIHFNSKLNLKKVDFENAF